MIERNVVPGNLHDQNDTLLVIAPLDHLWVWGSVFESDLKQVAIGQDWTIRFPFLDEETTGKVEYISNIVDPGSHAVRLRTSIPNPETRLRSNMVVAGTLLIPPRPEHTTVKRTALVFENGQPYVYVKTGSSPDVFERRLVGIEKELSNEVILREGVRPGEEVVSVGSLLLSQIYEDLEMYRTGAVAGSSDASARVEGQAKRSLAARVGAGSGKND